MAGAQATAVRYVKAKSMAGSWEHAFCCTFYDGAQIYVRNHERLRVPGATTVEVASRDIFVA